MKDENVPGKDCSQFNIIVVDDIVKNIQVLGNILRKSGYSISYATSGRQAIDMIQLSAFDLILLDVMMPEMDGFEVCRRLKEIPQAKDLPIIFLTAKTEREDIVRGFQSGAVDYVTKPFDSTELLARVRTHLELKQARDEVHRMNQELVARNEQLSTLNEELQQALRELKLLQGILHICSGCKKIRREGGSWDDPNSWVILEQYIQEHSEARFSHSICPECAEKLYPGLL